MPRSVVLYTYMFRRLGSEKGYTVLELLVTAMVMFVILSVTVSYSRRSDRVSRLARQTERLVNDIRRAQTLTLVTQRLPGVPGEAPCGYGLHFANSNRTQYILFAEVPYIGVPAVCPAGSPPFSPPSQYNGGDIIEETVVLEDGIEFDAPTGNADVVFHSPEPRTAFFPTSFTSLTITLRLQSDPSVDMQVRVNSTGQVEIIP